MHCRQALSIKALIYGCSVWSSRSALATTTRVAFQQKFPLRRRFAATTSSRIGQQQQRCALFVNTQAKTLTSLSSTENSSLSAVRGTTRTILDPLSQKCSFVKEDVPMYRADNIKNGRDFQKVLHVAEEAARQAGDIMIRTSGKIAVSQTKSNKKDLLTESDLACEALIKNIILQNFPQDKFLGEEEVAAGSDASIEALKDALKFEGTNLDDGNGDDRPQTLLWIVDPIDGTTNFQAGLPLFCTSIGVVSLSNNEDPEVVAGVIYNPVLNEMTSAVRGRGAYVNGKRLTVAEEGRQQQQDQHETVAVASPSSMLLLDESLVNIGFPVVKPSTLAASSRAVAALAPKVRGLRMVAVAAQVMAWTAQNKFQAYVSWDLNAWDVAAGMLIVKEAGGSVLDFSGKEATIQNSRDLIVTSSGSLGAGVARVLGEEILAILSEHDCLQYD